MEGTTLNSLKREYQMEKACFQTIEQAEAISFQAIQQTTYLHSANSQFPKQSSQEAGITYTQSLMQLQES
jgi:hypothetical protein